MKLLITISVGRGKHAVFEVPSVVDEQLRTIPCIVHFISSREKI